MKRPYSVYSVHSIAVRCLLLRGRRCAQVQGRSGGGVSEEEREKRREAQAAAAEARLAQDRTRGGVSEAKAAQLAAELRSSEYIVARRASAVSSGTCSSVTDTF